MPNIIYIKEKSYDGAENVVAISVNDLAESLKHHPQGFVGMETHDGGSTMIHYFYTTDSANNIQRYPLRKDTDSKLGYACVPGYAPFHKENHFFKAIDSLEGGRPPSLPERALFFSESDKPTIDAMMQAEHERVMQAAAVAPYFPEIGLTREQQERLYSGQCLPMASFSEPLGKFLQNPALTPETKQRALRACICAEDEPLKDTDPLNECSDEIGQIRNVFLSIGWINRFNKAILGEPTPTLRQVRDYYIRCIQSKLDHQVPQEVLFRLTMPDLFHCDKPVGSPASTDGVLSFPADKGLTERDDKLFRALYNLVTIMRAEWCTPSNIQQVILKDANLFDISDDLFNMLEDFQQVIDKKQQVPSQADYTEVYKYFFGSLLATQEDVTPEDAASLKKLPAIKSAYEGLKPLILAKKLHLLTAANRETLLWRLLPESNESSPNRPGTTPGIKAPLAFASILAQALEQEWAKAEDTEKPTFVSTYFEMLETQLSAVSLVSLEEADACKRAMNSLARHIQQPMLRSEVQAFILSGKIQGMDSHSMTKKLLLAVAYGMESSDPEVNIPMSAADTGGLFDSDLFAKDLLEVYPELLLKRAPLTDWAGRKFVGRKTETHPEGEGITAFEYALWAKDFKMIEMMLKRIPVGEEGEAIKMELLRQYEQVTMPRDQGGGLTYMHTYERPKVDIVGIPIKNASGNWDCETVTEERWGNHFDITPLIHAYEYYNTYYYVLDLDQRDAYWIKIIGTLQRLLPIHILQRYCDPVISFYPLPSFTGNFKRTTQFYNDLRSGLDSLLSSTFTLSSDFSLLSYSRSFALGQVVLVDDELDDFTLRSLDLEAVRQIDEVSTNEIEKIKRLLQAPGESPAQFRP